MICSLWRSKLNWKVSRVDNDWQNNWRNKRSQHPPQKSCKKSQKISALANWTWPSRQLLYTTVGIWKSNLENKRARRFYNPVDVSSFHSLPGQAVPSRTNMYVEERLRESNLMKTSKMLRRWFLQTQSSFYIKIKKTC